ncbi:MAG TPA: bifunctional 4-hydroxy-2-oxoglutarate aldolase/2-dehydro-3-deoxy-phosphogluconate aldolase [Candidatus Limnocylindrales bacterium]|nr:bifunctional 4-hydroxy-2-oxoglutarate aldolase/2-dehydro-3-deoxy-phosphogluconate aldolase [Candidatus Limnocylindrales bacterium]
MLEANAAALRGSSVADLIRSTRLVAILRCIEPRSRLPELVAAQTAGAAFAVSPSLDTGLVARSIELGLPFVAGAYSPTEIDLAWQAGATFVKLFPTSSLGPSHARELRGPFPEIECIATGGIDATNARAFLEAGCVAVGVGAAIARAEPADRRALVAAVRGLP